MTHARHAIAIAALILATAYVLPASADTGPGCAVREYPDVGRACLRPDGLYEVFSPDDVSLGFTHGPDPYAPPDDAGVADAARDPLCVQGANGDYYTHVIYAHASDQLSRYDSVVDAIRALVRNSNGIVHDAAVATGAAAGDLRVLCREGVIVVSEERLPTPAANARFSTIANDLRTKGYGDGRVKYWILYDDPRACGCGGQGSVYNDDRGSAANNNNGNAGPMYAINYGYLSSTRIWLHELGHNLGAVQHSAPQSTGGYHCIDGRDTMCYNDGGPRGGEYRTTYCAVEVWDCNKDDYFNANPEPGSYLATRWNLAATYVRFLRVNPDSTAPSVTLLRPDDGTLNLGCSTTPLGVPAPAVVLRRACVQVDARDAGGVTRVSAHLGGKWVASATTPMAGTSVYHLEFEVPVGTLPVTRLVVEARDAAGNAAHDAATVVVV